LEYFEKYQFLSRMARGNKQVVMAARMYLFSRFKWRGIIGIVLAACSLHAVAGWKTPREALDQRLIQDEFRIYYTLEGENAFPPDASPSQHRARAAGMLVSLVAQIGQASRFYREQLGLAPPLGGARYRDVRSIDVHIIKLEGRNGSAGDEPIVYHYREFDGVAPALTITLSNQWNPPNLTPNHEVFHAYQYGYTFFKNAWFLEGLARSMEKAFKGGEVRTEPLPRGYGQLQQVMGGSYGADVFWNRLMYLCDVSCSGSTSAAAWKTGSYVPRGRICGGGLVRAALEQYQTLDKQAARLRGIDPNDWPEEEQWSERNNPFLLLGLRRAIEKQCQLRSNPELEAFHKLLKETETRP
jgi:hypothetical protein